MAERQHEYEGEEPGMCWYISPGAEDRCGQPKSSPVHQTDESEQVATATTSELFSGGVDMLRPFRNGEAVGQYSDGFSREAVTQIIARVLATRGLPDCAICGGKRVLIRGRFPKEPEREVCPTCVTERLEQIQQIASMEYGAATVTVGTNQ